MSGKTTSGKAARIPKPAFKPTTTSLPENWPEEVVYIKEPSYSDAVATEVRRKLHTPTQATAVWPKVDAASCQIPSSLVQILPIIRINHPAKGQHGLFATRHLAASSFILLYIGQVHTNAVGDIDPQSNYDLSMDRDLDLSVDATRMGNEARFINDFRNVAEQANAEFRDCWVQQAEGSERRWERRIGVFVLPAGKAGKKSAGIARSEEILVSYGKSWWKERLGQ